MADFPSRGATIGASLPEPRHPFARWFGSAAVGIWALVVQSFADPWDKLGAILSPGVGYIIGQALQASISYVSNVSSNRTQRIDLEKATKKLDELRKERNAAQENGANSKILFVIDEAITVAHQEKVELISGSFRGERKSSINQPTARPARSRKN